MTDTGMLPGERTLRHLLKPIATYLDHPDTTEITVTRPGFVGVECEGIWSEHEAPELDFERLMGISILAAYQTGKHISRDKPTCASALPGAAHLRGNRRIKIAIPPAVPTNTVGLTIRQRAATFTPTLEWLADHGYFRALNPAIDWPAWFRDRVIDARRTLLIAGAIGSSKTTFGEAVLRAIPETLRIITIEGSPEWEDLPHPYRQAYYFDESRPETATQRVQDAMQSMPHWLMLQELRGDEAWAFFRALKVGTPGITTVHATSAAGALNSIESMVRQTVPGSSMDVPEVLSQLRANIGVIAYCRRTLPKHRGEPTLYRLTEVLEVGATAAEDRMVSAIPGQET
jgi:type IV secretion system protein VirB11